VQHGAVIIVTYGRITGRPQGSLDAIGFSEISVISVASEVSVIRDFLFL